MTNKTFLNAGKAGLFACMALLVARTGYAAEGRSPEQAQAKIEIQDDYDYFPGSETYYSRNRHEFVYHDGNTWVRRPEPRGVTANVLLTTPSVRMDFHDSPESHHESVTKSYPKEWKRGDANHAGKDGKDDHR